MKYENIDRVNVIVNHIQECKSKLERLELAEDVSISGPSCWIMSICFDQYSTGVPPELAKSFIESLKEHYLTEIASLIEELETL